MNDELTQTPTQRRSERLLLLLILGAFLLINLLTAARSPTIWVDEVQLLDPPASLYFGHGFRSAGLFYQSKEHVFVYNGLAYEGALYAWIRIFGFSPTAVRSLNYVLMALTVVLIHSAVRRLDLIRTMRGRLMLTCVLLCGYAMAFSYRSGRYDVLGTAEVAAAFAAYSVRRSWLRYALLALIGLCIVWTGLQILIMAAALGVLLLVATRLKAFASILAIGVGFLLGLASLYLGLKAIGEWDNFVFAVLLFPRKMAEHQPHGVQKLAHAMVETLRALSLLDYSLPFLLVALAIGLLVSRKPLQAERRPVSMRAALFGLATAVLVPFAMNLAGHYPIYYAWMAFVPASIAAVVVWESLLAQHPSTLVRCGSIALFVAACAIGLPARLVATSAQWSKRDYAPVERMVSRHLRGGEWVYCDYPGYYPARRFAEWVFMEPYFEHEVTDEEKARISTLIISPDDFAMVQKRIGGNWHEVDHYSSEPSAPPSAQAPRFTAKLYNLWVYKRTANSSTMPARPN